MANAFTNRRRVAEVALRLLALRDESIAAELRGNAFLILGCAGSFDDELDL